MQGIRKHTANIKMRGRPNYSLLPAVFAPVSARIDGAQAH
jgi:hypothetical protein